MPAAAMAIHIVPLTVNCADNSFSRAVAKFAVWMAKCNGDRDECVAPHSSRTDAVKHADKLREFMQAAEQEAKYYYVKDERGNLVYVKE